MPASCLGLGVRLGIPLEVSLGIESALTFRASWAFGEGTGMSRALAALSLLLVLCAALGCGKAAATSGEPEAKERLKHLLELYRHFVMEKGKGPANEQELKAYGQKLTPQDRRARPGLRRRNRARDGRSSCCPTSSRTRPRTWAAGTSAIW